MLRDETIQRVLKFRDDRNEVKYPAELARGNAAKYTELKEAARAASLE